MKAALIPKGYEGSSFGRLTGSLLASLRVGGIAAVGSAKEASSTDLLASAKAAIDHGDIPKAAGLLEKVRTSMWPIVKPLTFVEWR
jgi:hypothetical protein